MSALRLLKVTSAVEGSEQCRRSRAPKHNYEAVIVTSATDEMVNVATEYSATR